MRTSHEKGTRVKYSFIRLTMAVAAAAIISPVQAQIASPTAAPPPRSPAAYPGGSFPYAFPAPTPEDAYRDGLINRWQYEQLVGPLPQALQGPSLNGKGGDGGGDRGG